MKTCLHDPEVYGDPCELCAVSQHPARKAMAEALYRDRWESDKTFVGERMDMCDEVVDQMLTAAAMVGWTLHNATQENAEEEVVEDEQESS